jgi:hypothetical protein
MCINLDLSTQPLIIEGGYENRVPHRFGTTDRLIMKGEKSHLESETTPAKAGFVDYWDKFSGPQNPTEPK